MIRLTIAAESATVSRDPRWCSACLRRHVNKGYSVCLRCEMLRRTQPTTETRG